MSHALRDAAPVWDPAISIPTLTGSLLSLVATFVVISLWIFAGGRNRRDFRYALILNLTVAEFLNSLNNSISGIATVTRRAPLLPGTACDINGWAGQFSVQAVDFSILAITIITLLTIQLRSLIIYASTTTKACICLSIWIVPVCTSVIAWTQNYYGPVSGNWCWIEARYIRQRYTLNHGWRFAIIAISLCTYIYVFIYMSQRLRPHDLSNPHSSIPDNHNLDYKKLSAVLAGCGATPRDTPRLSRDSATAPATPTAHRRARSSFSFARPLQLDTTSAVAVRHDDIDSIDISPIESHILVDLEKSTHMPSPTAPPSFPPPFKRCPTEPRIDREIWKMLFLNIYPVTYLILWIPGIANRIAEALDKEVRWLAVAQASTQFIGFANAAVYVWKEHGRDVRAWWSGVRARRRAERARRLGL